MRGLRWLVVGLVALATIINYIDRNALAIMWPLGMSDDLGLGKEDYAFIVNCFLAGYLIGKALFGKIMDAIGTRIGFVLAIVVWSLSVALHAVVRSVFAFSAVRFAMGLGEAGNWPGATKANAEWFPIKERALAQGIFNAGASIGSIASPPLVGLLYALIGWQTTFLVLGALGFLWLVPWLIVYKSSPESHPWLTAREREHILRGRQVPDEDANASAATFAPGWWEMFRYRQSWAVIGSRFFIDPIWFLFVLWLPIYLVERFGFDVRDMVQFAWVPFVGAALGALFGGWLAQLLLARGWTVNRARKFAIAGEETVAKIKADGGNAMLFAGDMTVEADVERFVSAAQAAFGDAIHVLVNVTGGLIARRGLAEMDEAFLNDVMRLNLNATFLATKHVAPHMPDGGAIVNCASQAARDGGGPGAAAYASAKGAVMTFTRAMAKELGARNIRVNAVCPGMIDTTFHDTFTKDAVRAKVASETALGREGEAAEVGRLVRWLASSEASYVTGANFDVNGGSCFV